MANGINDNLYNVPIKVLSTKTQALLSNSLNTLMILPAENGLLRDWRGLSELLHMDVSLIEKHENPTQKLLELAQDDAQKYTLEIFISCLEALDRFDIIDDLQELIANDIRQNESNQNTIQSRSPTCQNESYDAMILYAERDVDFACQLVDVMEKKYNMRLFVQERNLKAGEKEVRATLSVIADRSNKLIVILSPNFLTSPTNEFFLDYAQTIAIEQKERKIIPVSLTDCEVPQQLRGLHKLYYSANSKWGSFWERLAMSIDPCAVPKKTCTSNTEIIGATRTNATVSESQTNNNLKLGPTPPPVLCPPVTNNNSKIQLPVAQCINMESACSSTSEQCGYGNKLTSTKPSKEKTQTKKASSIITKIKKKILNKRKDKIAVAI